MASKAKWTFMVYLAGDNNLSSAGDKDLGEMRAVGSTADVNVVAQFDNAGNRGTSRYLIKKGGNDLVQSLGETDSGSPDVLLDFVKWTATTYPADRYALILWNHGGGWEPLEMDKIARSVNAKDYNPRELQARGASAMNRAFFRTSLEKIFKLPTANDRAICSDDGTGHSLDTIELGNVLAETVKILGQPVDLLGMDACLMTTLEVAYQAKPYVQYVVGSEETEPGDGWDYQAILAKLVAKPRLKTAELAAHIVSSYIKFYAAEGSSDPITQSALNVAKIDTLTGPLDALAQALVDNMPKAKDKVIQAIWQGTSFYDDTLYDIGHFCELIGKLTPRTTIPKAAKAVRAALKKGNTRLVIAEGHSGRKVQKCAGVTIYIPNKTGISEFYGDLEFAKKHRWPAMLQKLTEE